MNHDIKEPPVRYLPWGAHRTVQSTNLALADDRIASAVETFFKVNESKITQRRESEL